MASLSSLDYSFQSEDPFAILSKFYSLINRDWAKVDDMFVKRHLVLCGIFSALFTNDRAIDNKFLNDWHNSALPEIALFQGLPTQLFKLNVAPISFHQLPMNLQTNWLFQIDPEHPPLKRPYDIGITRKTPGWFSGYLAGWASIGDGNTGQTCVSNNCNLCDVPFSVHYQRPNHISHAEDFRLGWDTGRYERGLQLMRHSLLVQGGQWGFPV